MERHTGEALVGFLEGLLATQPTRRKIHVILDNPSAHKSKRVQEWLSLNPRVTFHYTPTYSSWGRKRGQDSPKETPGGGRAVKLLAADGILCELP